MDNMFQCKIDAIFNDMLNISGIVDNTSVIGYDNDKADHDTTVHKVLRQCREVNSKLNKAKCHFSCMTIPLLGEVISREGIQTDPQKIKVLTDMSAPKNRKELQALLGIINYLGNFFPGTVDVCEPL